MRDKILRLLVPLFFWTAVWQLAAMGVGQELLLPPPVAVLERLFTLAGVGTFWQTAGLTLLRIFCGILFGVITGALLAVLTCAFKAADWILTPMVKIIRATPVASFIILVMLWVTRTYVPGLISALMVMPVIWGNVCKGIRETDKSLLELARAYRFGRGKTLRLVYIPSVMPYFSAGVNTSLGLAWKAGVAAEVLCLPRPSIGTELYNAKQYLETPSLFAWTLVVILLSFLLEKAVSLLLRAGERNENGRNRNN